MKIINKYNIGSKKAFVNLNYYLENSDKATLILENEECVDFQDKILVPCKKYGFDKTKISLVGKTLIDIRFCRIDGELKDVRKIAKLFQKIAGDKELFYLENGR